MPAYLANCSWASPRDKTNKTIVNPGHPFCHTLMQYKALTRLPTSFEDWYDLVKALVQYSVDIFGLSMVQTWHFECWNEMWGTPWDQYMKLYNAWTHAIKAVHPSLQVGGPATFQLTQIVEFARDSNAMGAPFNFFSTHMYPTDPQCPKNNDWGPDCLPDKVKLAKESLRQYNMPMHLTEYNVGCCIGDGHHDHPGAAAFVFRTIPKLHNVTDVLSWWTLTDIFEEDMAVDQHKEYMAIYGLMTILGVPKPSWRAFQLLHEHAGDRLLSVSIHEPSSALEYQALKCTAEKDAPI